MCDTQCICSTTQVYYSSRRCCWPIEENCHMSSSVRSPSFQADPFFISLLLCLFWPSKFCILLVWYFQSLPLFLFPYLFLFQFFPCHFQVFFSILQSNELITKVSLPLSICPYLFHFFFYQKRRWWPVTLKFRKNCV